MPEDFAALKETFLDEVRAVVTMEQVPPMLILNRDQTGIHIVPVSSWTMDKEGSKGVGVIGANDKKQITAVFCGSLTGDHLPLQLIYMCTRAEVPIATLVLNFQMISM